MTDTLSQTTICSFYQVSKSIYDLFDRVLVLDKGRMIYFGPTKEARKYFFDMGFTCEVRKSTPDFLSAFPIPTLIYRKQLELQIRKNVWPNLDKKTTYLKLLTSLNKLGEIL